MAENSNLLLCSENNITCFDDDDDDGDDLECNVAAADGSGILPCWDHTNNLNSDQPCPSSENRGSGPLYCFDVLSEETMKDMVEREKEHLPKEDYLKRLRSGDLDLSGRRETIDWIWKRGKSWTMQLLAVACLSIGAKMEEVKVPQSVDLQVGEPKFVFEAKTIQRMELLVLSTLRWKMQALTPCSFIDYFLKKITFKQHLANRTISRSIQLTLSIIRGIDFLEFRPSEIAAAVAISVSKELQQAKDIDKALASFFIAEKEKVLKCVELIRDLALMNVSNFGAKHHVPFVPQSPIGVLDGGGCLSYKSDELTTLGSSCPNSPKTKRFKSEGGPCCNGTSDS
ncbi:cyclin-D4-1 isoform X2 [Arachis duranensis]|uniref:B-like cyclin n=1 Tax=Arachis duranensis TaxID=130453 RepID=A0A9C6WIZ6_ARADU|nr:cyclin-D4-1 isoform X2 [Arachis duranensis]